MPCTPTKHAETFLSALFSSSLLFTMAQFQRSHQPRWSVVKITLTHPKVKKAKKNDHFTPIQFYIMKLRL